MLVTERISDGRTVVRLHKDWHPNRIGKAYNGVPKHPIADPDAYRLQSALLRSSRASNR